MGKISDLTTATAITADDYLVMVDDPGGTPATKKITAANAKTYLGGGAVATDAIFDAKGDLPVGTGADTAAKLAVGSKGYTLKCDATTTTGLKYQSENPAVTGGSGYYVNYGMNGWTTNGIAIGSNVANSTDRAWGFRMLLPPISITTMAVNVQTAADATSYLRLALYAADGTNGEPGTLLQDAGTVAINSTGTKTATFTSLPVGGWYWAVAFSSVTGTVVPKLAAPSDAIAGFLLSDISSNVGVFKTHGYVAYTYPANAPSTCPTLDATHIQPASGAAFYIGVI